MRIYAQADEERIHVQAQVREWARSGLIDKARADVLDAELKTDLKRTNSMLRAVLAFFTALIVAASVGLIFVTAHIRGDAESGTVLLLAAVACFVVANAIVANVGLYRYGVEEALAALGVLMATIGAALLLSSSRIATTFDTQTIAGLAVAAALSLVVYLRFGYVYAAVAAMVCAAFIPFEIHTAPWAQRLLAAGDLFAVFVIARVLLRRHGDDYRSDDYAWMQAAAWGGVYVLLNLKLFDMLDPGILGVSHAVTESTFYWITYALTWLLPAIGLTIAIRDKDRPFLGVNLAMALATLITNKPYLGWPRQSWDPMLLGILLIGGAIAIRRWLANGPGGQRAGFTPERVLERDREMLGKLGTISAAVPASPAPAAADRSPGFGGGRSGGGGASGSF